MMPKSVTSITRCFSYENLKTKNTKLSCKQLLFSLLVYLSFIIIIWLISYIALQVVRAEGVIFIISKQIKKLKGLQFIVL